MKGAGHKGAGESQDEKAADEGHGGIRCSSGWGGGDTRLPPFRWQLRILPLLTRRSTPAISSHSKS
jgi:hypothetical protein